MLSAVARATSSVEIAGEPPTDPVTCDDGAPLGSARFLRPAQRVGRYTIGAPRGLGSMGVVYEAYDTELARTVALKLLRDAGGAAVDVGRARLVREAQALARLSHPNVVAIHDIGTYDNEVFVAMELVEGATLDEWLHAAPRAPAEILEVARVARGLDEYTRAWVAMHTDTCAATAVRGEQSPEVLTLRMACLGKDLDLTRQLVDLFVARGFTGTAQAVMAVDGLPRLATCADITALKAVAPLPADPANDAALPAELRSLKQETERRCATPPASETGGSPLGSRFRFS